MTKALSNLIDRRIARGLKATERRSKRKLKVKTAAELSRAYRREVLGKL